MTRAAHIGQPDFAPFVLERKDSLGRDSGSTQCRKSKKHEDKLALRDEGTRPCISGVHAGALTPARCTRTRAHQTCEGGGTTAGSPTAAPQPPGNT